MGLLLFAMITPNDFHICFRGNHEIVQPRSHSSLPSAPQSLGEEAGWDLDFQGGGRKSLFFEKNHQSFM